MIERPTVFVLGAGVSSEYGYPSGLKLFNDICGALVNPQIRPLGKALLSAGWMRDELVEFQLALSQSGQISVDRFLEYNSDWIELGKDTISASLIPCETKGSVFINPEGISTYQMLFRFLSADFDEYKENNVSFITYNYDRSLEHFLVRALSNSYSRPIGQCRAKIEGLNIIHLHGVLGNYPGLGQEGRAYDGTVTPDTISRCRPMIKIIHEADTENAEFLLARGLLKDAENVCFLGFGYDDMNLRRLHIDEIGMATNIYGSAYDFGDAEKARVMNFFGRHIQPPRVKIGGSNHKSVDYLKNNFIPTEGI